VPFRREAVGAGSDLEHFAGKQVITMMGDRVEIVIDTGDGSRTYTVEATRAGRRVEVSHGRGLVEVTEVTRGGTPVRTARFMAARVLALVEHPAVEDRPPAAA
jgi:hypothetical protein